MTKLKRYSAGKLQLCMYDALLLGVMIAGYACAFSATCERHRLDPYLHGVKAMRPSQWVYSSLAGCHGHESQLSAIQASSLDFGSYLMSVASRHACRRSQHACGQGLHTCEGRGRGQDASSRQLNACCLRLTPYTARCLYLICCSCLQLLHIKQPIQVRQAHLGRHMPMRMLRLLPSQS